MCENLQAELAETTARLSTEIERTEKLLCHDCLPEPLRKSLEGFAVAALSAVVELCRLQAGVAG